MYAGEWKSRGVIEQLPALLCSLRRPPPCPLWFGVQSLAKFSLGRRLLLAFPRLFTFGLFSHAGPSEEQMAATSFAM